MTVVVPFPPGAATDTSPRAAGKRMGALLDTEAKTRVHTEGGVFGPVTPEQFSAFLTTQLQKNAKAIREAGLNRE